MLEFCHVCNPKSFFNFSNALSTCKSRRCFLSSSACLAQLDARRCGGTCSFDDEVDGEEHGVGCCRVALDEDDCWHPPQPPLAVDDEDGDDNAPVVVPPLLALADVWLALSALAVDRGARLRPLPHPLPLDPNSSVFHASSRLVERVDDEDDEVWDDDAVDPV